jgi:hypothetical protein
MKIEKLIDEDISNDQAIIKAYIKINELIDAHNQKQREEDVKCNCCGWDDMGFVHEPGCAILEERKKEDVISEVIYKLGQLRCWLYGEDEIKLFNEAISLLKSLK